MRLALLALLCGFTCFPAAAQDTNLATGQFLVASRDLGDPNFAETVVLLVRFDEDDGALGLVINRRSDVPLSRAFDDVKQAKDRSDLIYLGGPVQQDAVLALVRATAKTGDAKRVFGDVYLISSRTLLEKTLASGLDASKFHVFVGYAGWGPGQLEHEVQLGGWHILRADADTVFHADPDAVWERLIRRTETQIAQAGRNPPALVVFAKLR